MADYGTDAAIERKMNFSFIYLNSDYNLIRADSKNECVDKITGNSPVRNKISISILDIVCQEKTVHKMLGN